MSKKINTLWQMEQSMLHLPGLGLCTVAKQKRRYILWYNALEN